MDIVKLAIRKTWQSALHVPLGFILTLLQMYANSAIQIAKAVMGNRL